MHDLPNPPIYELFAIRYATRDAVRSEHFIGGDPHDGPMPMDYFIWLAKLDDHVIVIDSGFTANMAKKRNRNFLKCPVQSLANFGIAADMVNDVILTHLHYDHSGNFDRFLTPNSTFQSRSYSMPPAWAICNIRICSMLLNSTMSAGWCG